MKGQRNLSLRSMKGKKERKSIFQILPLIARHSLSVAFGFYSVNLQMFLRDVFLFSLVAMWSIWEGIKGLFDTRNNASSSRRKNGDVFLFNFEVKVSTVLANFCNFLTYFLYIFYIVRALRFNVVH